MGGIYLLYANTFSYGFSFDDFWNLESLGRIRSAQDALAFSFGGNAGPGGRPLALASFAVQLHSWPDNPEDFSRFNALVHVLNGVLLTWLCVRLLPILQTPVPRPAWTALVAGLLWTASPILVSTSAMIIQRMTLMSATFTLLATIGFVVGRSWLASHSARGFLMMSVSVGAGTMSAVLCKENGALTPFLVMCCEYAICVRTMPLAPATRRQLNVWRALFFGLPALMLVVYCTVNWGVIGNGYSFRNFTLGERLLTECRILVEYMRQIVAPVRSSLGPFKENYQVSISILNPPTTLLSLLALLSILVLAWRSARTSLHYLTFGIAWFFVGHLLESSFLPLELYFEHRNYVPSMGLLFACTVGAEELCRRHKAFLFPILFFVCNIVFVLRETTLVWQSQFVAGNVWHLENPGSVRAMQLYLRSVFASNDPEALRSALDKAALSFGRDQAFAASVLLAYCDSRPPDDVALQAEKVILLLQTGRVLYTVPEAIDKLYDRTLAGECKGVETADLLVMLDSILQNPGERTGPGVLAMAHDVYARYYLKQGNLDRTMYHLEESFRLRPTLSIGISMVGALYTAQLYDEANLKIDELERAAPLRPYVHAQWVSAANGLRRAVAEAVDKPAARVDKH